MRIAALPSIVIALTTLVHPAFGTDATPARSPAKPRIEVCFVLDTTGSMSGLIEGAKQKIWSIANEIAAARPAPDIRFGLIGYRDRGDEYILKTMNLTNDLDAIYARLQSFTANGGGDTPESVNEALAEAVNGMSWSADRGVLKIVFLVGDAPPHMDYPNAPQYPEICRAAAKKDLIINTIQCGNMSETTPIWREMAKLCEGSYAAIEQSGGMVAIATPMDEKLAVLNRKLGTTLVAYGSASTRSEVLAKQAASEAAPAATAADRLAFNMKTGVAVQGEGELLDSLASGKLDLGSIRKDDLPADLRNLNDKDLESAIAQRQEERARLQNEIQQLSRDRNEYIAAEQKRLAADGKGDSFDQKVSDMIHTQAASKGINY